MNDIMDTISWLGHAAFRIDGDITVYFDPFHLSDGPTADLILVTHTHYDHYSPEDIKKITGPDTTLVITGDADVPGDIDVVRAAPGKTLDVKGVRVSAVAAYNTNKSFHPKENRWVGYVLTMGGNKIYHTGDTDVIPEMEGIGPDVALVPVGGTYTMSASEAARAVKLMNAVSAVPMHWGEIVGERNDAVEFEKLVGGFARVVIKEKK
ncbi:MAG: MBL fold metallo-hydrolase [Deltaproteobacteria bacterium]|nr:MBL fold metallo-hydrolase [Candidatus Zymogenaceae bacterium]